LHELSCTGTATVTKVAIGYLGTTHAPYSPTILPGHHYSN